MTSIPMSETAAFPVLEVLKSFLEAVRSLRDRHAKRRAIAALLEMESVRLDDLGITADDIRESLNGHAPAGSRLTAIRAARAVRCSPKAALAV